MNVKKLIKLVTLFVALAFFSMILLVIFRKDVPLPNPESLIIYPIESCTVERLSNNSIKLRWEVESNLINIYYSKTLDQLEQPPNLGVEIKSPIIKEYIFTGLESNERYYFLLTFKNGTNSTHKIIVSERILPLTGANNFRDLGGYKTKDGRRIKWGLLYRSSSLERLTKEDISYLSMLNIKSIYDLRTIDEKKADPDIVPLGIHYYHFPIYDSKDQPGGFTILLPGADLNAEWENFYKTMLIDKKAKQFGKFLKTLANSKSLPAVFHCTAGKDRAGIAAALLLIAIGVPDETVIADYTLSNKYFDTILHHAQNQFDKHRIVMCMLNAKAETLAPFYLADPKIMELTLTHIKDKYGSYENYFIQAAGLDIQVINELKDNFLN